VRWNAPPHFHGLFLDTQSVKWKMCSSNSVYSLRRPSKRHLFGSLVISERLGVRRGTLGTLPRTHAHCRRRKREGLRLPVHHAAHQRAPSCSASQMHRNWAHCLRCTLRGHRHAPQAPSRHPRHVCAWVRKIGACKKCPYFARTTSLRIYTSSSVESVRGRGRRPVRVTSPSPARETTRQPVQGPVAVRATGAEPALTMTARANYERKMAHTYSEDVKHAVDNLCRTFIPVDWHW